MMDLMKRVKELWTTRHDEVLKHADGITSALGQLEKGSGGKALGASELKTSFQQLENSFDKVDGGFGQAPKFPRPHNLLFLLRHWHRTGDKGTLDMVEKTLNEIRQGGIYDHIGFGIHRYSTDARWLVPHFEKMLYDQAMMAMAFVETYQATGNAEYKKTAEEIFAYVLRDMTGKEGGFFTAEDADSEGEEGLFYLWKPEEIGKILGKEEADLILKIFNVEKGGNFIDSVVGKKTGENILHLKKPLKALSSDLKLPEKELKKRIESARLKLFSYREKRIHPYKDDKVLTDWNGLMIAALAKGAKAFGEKKYSDASERAAKFILKKLRSSNGRLLHRYRDGQSAIMASVDDYAFLIWGLVDLYEATFDVVYLRAAIDLQKEMNKHFWDDKNGGFYFTADDGEKLLLRQKEIYDAAIPSGNSVAMLNLLRLGRIAADVGFEEKAAKLNKAFSDDVRKMPSAYPQLMMAVNFAEGPSYEVVIAGDRKDKSTKEMLREIRRAFIPNKVMILRPTEEKMPEITALAAYTRYHTTIDNKATAYVCRNYNCALPTTDAKKMLELLQ
jgi:hypothetical protein